MGVRDFTCGVCGEPTEYECREATGGECEPAGIGDDEAFLTFLSFRAGEAPGTPDGLLAEHTRALRRETYRFGYDWGAWEFVPSLDYYDVLGGPDDECGVWRLEPHHPKAAHPVEVDLPAGEEVWVVNCCSSCWSHFVLGVGGPRCRLYEAQVAKHLGVARAEIEGAVRALGVLPDASVTVRTPERVVRDDPARRAAEAARRLAERQTSGGASSGLILPGQPPAASERGAPSGLILPPGSQRRPGFRP